MQGAETLSHKLFPQLYDFIFELLISPVNAEYKLQTENNTHFMDKKSREKKKISYYLPTYPNN